MNKDKFTLISQLIRDEYFLFGDFALKNGRVSPYISKYKSKKELSNYSFKLIAKLSLPTFENFDCFHLVGIENSGIKFSKYIHNALLCSNKKVSYQSFNLKNSNVNKAYKQVVVIDNAITTGETLIRFKKSLLPSQGIVMAIRIFNRMEKDNKHGTVDDFLFEKYNIPVFSIINVYDLLDYLIETNEFSKWKDINDYLSKYC